LQQLFELEKSNSSYAPIPAQIATVYMQNAEFAEAVKSLKRALDLDPRNTRYKFAIAICYEYLNFNQEALAIYKDLYSSIKKKGLVFDDKKIIEERIYLLSKYLEQNQA
jgi:Tfp pilus assembly protein PilF